MARPSSQNLRERMARAVLAGQSRHAAAGSFDVSPGRAIKLMQQFEPTGDCRPRKFGGHKRHTLAAHEAKVRASVAARPGPASAAITPLQLHHATGHDPGTQL